jgi:transposase InsO family protein
VSHVQSALGVSERRACRVIGQHRSTRRYQKRGREDDADLTAAVVELARLYGRYGYRRIWGLLCLQGWQGSNGPEFVAKAVRGWLDRLDVKPLYIEPGSPWENGDCESFNGKLSDELLAREIFYRLQEAQILIERWRRHDNTVRPHSALGYRPPAPETILPSPELTAYAQRRPSPQGQNQPSRALS